MRQKKDESSCGKSPGVRKKKVTDEPCESIIKTIVEGHVSSGNVHSAGR